MFNIVIPMAGAGSRFVSAGFLKPKPLILVEGIPMIQLVINNLRPNCKHRFIFICQKSHLETYPLEKNLQVWAPGCDIICIDGITEGAACTVLAAKKLINNSQPLMIGNSDQYVDIDIDKYLCELSKRQLDGLIMTMKANDPKWSYVGLNKNNEVIRVVEKKVISNEATVGIYNFKKGSDFILAAEMMIDKNLRVNNEFYVAPTYEQLINNKQRIGIFNVGEEANGMHGLGTPEDFNLFLGSNILKKAVMGLV